MTQRFLPSTPASASAPPAGPLLALLNEREAAREQRRTARPVPRDVHDRPTRPDSLRNHFLIELEVTGSPTAAARSAGCTLDDVRAWRGADPKFARDFTLAIVAHLRALRLMVAKLAVCHPLEPARHEAVLLLGQEHRYVDSDGLLNVRSWCDALHAFTHGLGLELGSWDPDLPYTSDSALEATG
ncbi:MAG: hypothetical protein ACRDHX_14490 [Chloroflexota bacterium]